MQRVLDLVHCWLLLVMFGLLPSRWVCYRHCRLWLVWMHLVHIVSENLTMVLLSYLKRCILSPPPPRRAGSGRGPRLPPHPWVPSRNPDVLDWDVDVLDRSLCIDVLKIIVAFYVASQIFVSWPESWKVFESTICHRGTAWSFYSFPSEASCARREHAATTDSHVTTATSWLRNVQ